MVSSGWISALLGFMGGCFGCLGPSKGLTIQGWKGRSSFSEDFWSSSACEIEHSALKSQRSISSISISSHSLDLSGSTSHPSEFVNNGLLLWNQTRQQWVGSKKSEKQKQLQVSVLSFSRSWNAIYDSLHGSTKAFPQAVPLSGMVDFLDEVWEQEGLYD